MYCCIIIIIIKWFIVVVLLFVFFVVCDIVQDSHFQVHTNNNNKVRLVCSTNNMNGNNNFPRPMIMVPMPIKQQQQQPNFVLPHLPRNFNNPNHHFIIAQQQYHHQQQFLNQQFHHQQRPIIPSPSPPPPPLLPLPPPTNHLNNNSNNSNKTTNPSSTMTLDVYAVPFHPQQIRNIFRTPASIQYTSKPYHLCDTNNVGLLENIYPLPLPLTKQNMQDFTDRSLWNCMLQHEQQAHEDMINQWIMHNVLMSITDHLDPIYFSTRARHVIESSEILIHVEIPGILENKPPLRFDDVVQCRWMHDSDVEYRARVVHIFRTMVTLRVTGLIGLCFIHDNNHSPPPLPQFSLRFPNFDRGRFLSCHMRRIVNEYVKDPIREIILNQQQQQQRPKSIQWFNPILNNEQKRAVQGVLENLNPPKLPFVIFGPPGTGKSLTAIEMVLQIFYQNPHHRILLCAPSDAACDILTSRLVRANMNKFTRGTDLLRINSYKRHPQEVLDVNFVLPFCNTVIGHTTSGPLEPEFALSVDNDKLSLAAPSPRICVMTTKMLGVLKYDRPFIFDLKFTHVIVDESSQALEPETLLALSCAMDDVIHKIPCQRVLLGDPRQLPPIVHFNHDKFQIDISLIENLMNTSPYTEHDPSCFQMLISNYRAHQSLIQLSSDLFYRGLLKSVALPNLTNLVIGWEKLPNPQFPAMFYNVSSVENNILPMDGMLFVNHAEIDVITMLILDLFTNKEIALSEIGVVALFRSQVILLRTTLRSTGLGQIRVGTVDDFQGQEVSCLFISTTVPNMNWIRVTTMKNNNTSKIYGYIQEYIGSTKRFNVAITRARALTVVVGNGSVLNEFHDTWSEWIRYCLRNNALAGEEMIEFKNEIASLERENMVKEIRQDGVWGGGKTDMDVNVIDVYLREMYGGE
jgi:hypothetical protein